MAEHFDKAVAAWREALDDARVFVDEQTVGRFARTLMPQGTTPHAVLRPHTTEEVQAIVHAAAEHHVPLYPIARGRNWGYGAATAPTDGQVIIDMSEMCRIIEVNEQLAYAVIEPGVSQGQMYEYLAKHHPNLWMDATGAGLSASIVGNTLDRGFGHTPMGDHVQNCAGMEVVLANGQLLKTGYGQFDNAKAVHAYKYGLGPVLDGIFSQSNLGIITRLGVWLNPKPESFCAFFASIKEDDLKGLVDRLLPLRMSGVLRSAVHVANDLRVMSSRISYPSHHRGDGTHLSRGVRQTLCRELDLGTWNVSAGIYGSREIVKAAKRTIRLAMGSARVIFLDDRKLAFAKAASKRLSGIKAIKRKAELLPIVEPAYELLKGKPSDEFLRGVLWQVPVEELRESLDPLDYNVGLIWVSPVVPATGEHADAVTRLLEPIYNRHGFDFLITLTFVTERALCCVTNITFDKRDKQQRENAVACYEQAIAALLKAGYPPYRTSPTGIAKIVDHDNAFWRTARAIKQALDPDNIIAPGRYIR